MRCLVLLVCSTNVCLHDEKGSINVIKDINSFEDFNIRGVLSFFFFIHGSKVINQIEWKNPHSFRQTVKIKVKQSFDIRQ